MKPYIFHNIMIPLFISIVGGVISGLIVTENFRKTLKNVVPAEIIKKIGLYNLAMFIFLILVFLVFFFTVSKGWINIHLDDPVYLVEQETGRIVEHSSRGRKYTGEKVNYGEQPVFSLFPDVTTQENKEQGK